MKTKDTKVSLDKTNLFNRMTSKQKREFNKLPEEDKGKIVVEEVKNKVMAVANKEIANSVIRGFYIAYQELYDNYVVPISNAKKDEEVNALVEKLLTEITKVHSKTEAELNEISKGE